MNKTIFGKFEMAVTGLLAAMYLFFLNPYLDVRGYNAHDPAAYLSKAIALWRGAGYGEQYADVFLPVTAQPPIFSFLVSPLIGIFGANFVLLKLFMLVFAVFFVVALYRFFNHFLDSKKQAVSATLLMMSSPVIFGLSHRVLADIPTFLFVVSALWSLDCYLKETNPIFSKTLIFSAVTFSVSYLTKQTALAVWVGSVFLFLHPYFRNKTVTAKMFLYTAISFVPIMLWHGWARMIPDDLWYWTTPPARDYFWQNPFTPVDGYISIPDFLVRIRHNLVWGIFNNIATVFFAPFYFLEGGLIGFFLSCPIVLWLIWQWGKTFVKQPSVLEGFVFFSLALLVPKYLGMAMRYVAIIWPAVVIYGIRGTSFLSEQAQRYLFNLFIVISLSTTLIISIDQWKNPYGSKTLEDYVSIAEKAKEFFSQQGVCKAPLVPHWQVLTGHKCQLYGQDLVTYFVSLSERAPQDLERYQDVERDALQGAKSVGDLWKDRPGDIELVFQNNTFALFKVNHD